MRRLLVPVALVVPSFLFIACGRDSTPGGGDGGSASTSATGSSSASGIGGAGTAAVAEYCNATSEAFCEAYFACCPDPNDLSLAGGTVEDCKKLYGYGGFRCTPGNAELYAASVEAGHTLFDRASLHACVAYLKAMAVGGAACVEPPRTYLLNICSTRVFQGQLTLDETCVGIPAPTVQKAVTSECKHGYCDKATRTCQPLAQLGEPCLQGNAWDCEQGEYLVCDELPDAGFTCLNHGDVGEPCTLASQCRSYNCDMMTGTCGLPDAYIVCGSQ